jgi:hypothetical protein
LKQFGLGTDVIVYGRAVGTQFFRDVTYRGSLKASLLENLSGCAQYFLLSFLVEIAALTRIGCAPLSNISLMYRHVEGSLEENFVAKRMLFLEKTNGKVITKLLLNLIIYMGRKLDLAIKVYLLLSKEAAKGSRQRNRSNRGR